MTKNKILDYVQRAGMLLVAVAGGINRLGAIDS